MTESNSLVSRCEVFHAAIAAFIEERRLLKEKDNNFDASKFEYAFWLADAARRVGQIQAVTHVLKATHPDAKGSSLHVELGELTQHSEVGSHVLANDFADDVVGNAAALDVYRFLRTEVEGRRLLDWVLDGDTDLLAALSADETTANNWMQAFASLVRKEQQPVSHAMAKQLYWLVEEDPTLDENYHLLQPLFSSSLAHAVHADIQAARFGEANKEARQAQRKKEPHDSPYHNYLGLAVRKLGGTKPQNISQLNSERGGINYLLPSLPPTWHSDKRIRLLKVDSVMAGFYWFDDVRELVNQLSRFLRSDPDPTLETRSTRQALEQALGQQLVLFGDSIRFSQELGWTRNPDCKLPMHEKLWLDPERTELPVRETHQSEDEEFNAAYEFGDWPDQVAGGFARWMNAQLHKAKVTAVGDAEYKHWARQAILDVDWPISQQRRAAGGEA